MDDVLVSLQELNRCFLGLAAGAGDHGLPRRLAQLGAGQRAAVAECPYALFDIRFGDSAHWSRRLRDPSVWQVADVPRADPAALEFVGIALFYVWHVARSAPLRAPLLLGMPRMLVPLFASQTVDRLPALAALEAAQLAPRWESCDGYWDELLGAALRPGSDALRRAQLRGIQFAAAMSLGGGGILPSGGALRPKASGV